MSAVSYIAHRVYSECLLLAPNEVIEQHILADAIALSRANM